MAAQWSQLASRILDVLDRNGVSEAIQQKIVDTVEGRAPLGLEPPKRMARRLPIWIFRPDLTLAVRLSCASSRSTRSIRYQPQPAPRAT
jgi:hypothetical protein